MAEVSDPVNSIQLVLENDYLRSVILEHLEPFSDLHDSLFLSAAPFYYIYRWAWKGGYKLDYKEPSHGLSLGSFFIIACELGDTEMVYWSFLLGISVDFVVYGAVEAAKKKRYAVCEWICSDKMRTWLGDESNCRRIYGCMLEVAAMIKDGKIRRMVQKVWPNAGGSVAIRSAIINGDVEMVKFACKKIEDQGDSVDCRGGLRMSAEYGHDKLFEFFRKRGPYKMKDLAEGASTLGRLDWCKEAYSEQERNSETIPSVGRIDPEIMLYNGAINGHCEICLFAMEKGAKKWEKVIHDGRTYEHLDICKLALQRNPEKASDIAKIAAGCGKGDICLMAEGYGHVDWNGVLCSAVRDFKLDIVILAINKGANDWIGATEAVIGLSLYADGLLAKTFFEQMGPEWVEQAKKIRDTCIYLGTGCFPIHNREFWAYIRERFGQNGEDVPDWVADRSKQSDDSR